MWECQGAMLTAEELVRRRTKTDVVLPSKCPKSFSPTDSWLESKQLQSLLDATKSLIAEERVERESALAQAEWDENLKVARVTRVVGKQFEKFGHEENMTIFLYPEEALYLLETNHLQLLYGGVSMSIQQAYTVLISSKTGCTFTEYMVFTHLLKNGFKVLRHSAKRTITRYERLIGLCQVKQKNRKLKRTCNVPEKVSNEGNGDGDDRVTQEKVETKSRSFEKKEKSNSSTQTVAKEEKGDKNVIMDSSINVIVGNSTSPGNTLRIETTIDGHSSSPSDIEILSEKSLCKTEESLEYDITDYSSFSSEDSDCQVIFSAGTEVQNAYDMGSCPRNRVIEEINLSDSEESNTCNDNFDERSQLKIECCKVEILCDKTESKMCQTSYEEQNDSKTSIASENFMELNSVQGSSVFENNDHCVDASDSNILTKPECVNQELPSEQTFEEKYPSVIRFCSSKSQILSHENTDNILVCGTEIKDVKDELVCGNINPGFLILPKEIKNQKVESTLVKNESNSNAFRVVKEQGDIEVIELDDEISENGVLEDRDTILNSFPNGAGCHVVHCDTPPQRLCPPNVCPVHQSYSIVIDHLHDPRYGGNPRKARKVQNTRFQNHYVHQNRGHDRNVLGRFHNRPNRQYNRRFMNSSRHIERQDQCENYSNMHREESFSNQMMFLEQTSVYSPFQPTCTVQREQSAYPDFAGQTSHALPFYQHPRTGLRTRGHIDRDNYNQYSPFRRYPVRNSHLHRFPRRKGRGSRTAYPDRFIASSEVSNERERNYMSHNNDDPDGHAWYEQDRRTRDHAQNQRRFRRPYEENANCSGPGRKRRRGQGARYFSPSGRSQDLTEFLHLIRNDNEENAVVDSTPVVTMNCGGGGGSSNSSRQVFPYQSAECASALAESCSTDSTSSTGRSSCSSSSHGSDESVNESTDEEEMDNISILLKSDDMEDIDTSLKSLEIVDTVKFKGLTALTDEPLLTIKFDLYQPFTPFKRSDPPVPDFRVIVMQPDQYLPTSRQLAFLGEGFDDDVPLLFAISSSDSVAFYLQSVVNLPHVSSRERVEM